MSAVIPVEQAEVMRPATVSERLKKNQFRHLKERVVEAVLFLAASISVFTTVAIVYILIKESVVFFQSVSIFDFLTDTQWTPLFDDAHFGIMVLLSGTLTSSIVALTVAIPLGTVIAIYLSEFAPFKVREIAKPFLELLGGVPTIVYGYFNLAATLAIIENKVLIVDADPQANANSGVGVKGDQIGITTYECLTEMADPRLGIIKTETPNLYLLPSSIDLVGAEIELVGIGSKGISHESNPRSDQR